MVKAAPSNDGRRANRRGAARLAAVQALYQMDLAATPLNEALGQFEAHWIGREVEGEEYLPAEAAYFRDVVKGVVEDQRRLDPMIDAVLAKAGRWSASRRCCARSCGPAPTELDRKTDVPARVVVSEYADIANAFVERDETGMINAVLDQLARQLRAGEFEAAR